MDQKNKEQELNPVISIYLDYLLEVTGIDPSAVFPDDKLCKDLNLSAVQIEKVVAGTAKALKIELHLTNHQIADITSRQIVDIVSQQLMERSHTAAA